MNSAFVDQIVNAVLYEGYILYPYRPSVKNRQRWTFGGLCPQSYSAAQGGSEAWAMQTECLVTGSRRTVLDVKVRFLHLLMRSVGELTPPLAEWPAHEEPAYRVVESLQAGDRQLFTWQEAVERTIDLDDLDLEGLVSRPRRQPFAFPARRDREPIRGPAGPVVGVIVREHEAVTGAVEASAERAGEGLFKVRIRVLNHTPLDDAGRRSRDDALLRSLVSTHTILGVRGGAFVSLLDPPEACRAAAAGCRNEGTWPVLVGEPGATDAMLSSPIILYDYPQIAPESPGDLFDATEIDEILTLRILALSAEEKLAMAAVDERARALLQRTEALAGDQFLSLHGAVRGLRPVPAEDGHD
jgi:hydrogenase maturation protease